MKKILITASAFVFLIGAITLGLNYKLKHRLITTKDVTLLFPKGKSKALILSFDDGNIQDTGIVKILNKYGLIGTFFLHTQVLESNPQSEANSTLPRYVNKNELRALYRGHEVGGHGITHDRLDQMNDKNQYEELKESKDSLNWFLNDTVQSIAYPYGYYNAKSIIIAKDLGYTNARTITNTYSFDLPVDFMQWHPTCNLSEVDNYLHSFLKSDSPFTHRWKRLLYQKLSLDYTPIKVMYVWGHSTDITDNENPNWKDFEKLCNRFAEQDDLWSTTAGTLSSYISSIHQLVITKYEITNPSFNKEAVWFQLSNNIHIIKPGQTFSINESHSHSK